MENEAPKVGDYRIEKSVSEDGTFIYSLEKFYCPFYGQFLYLSGYWHVIVKNKDQDIIKEVHDFLVEKSLTSGTA